MQDFNNLTYTTSDQHKETTDARLNRDIHDLAKINSRLIPFTLFSEDRSLRNIVTGIEALISSHQHSTTLTREGTDLLILLLHYADTDPDIKDLYFRSEKTCATNVQDINRLKAIRHQTYAHSFSSFMHSLVVIQRQGYLVSERRRLSRN